MNYIIKSIEGTQAFANALSRVLKPGDVLCLSGDLGAGKTTFSQFLCKALGVDDYVTSPTFNIMNQYEASMPIYHFDVYRIFDEDEMLEIGFEDFLYGEGLCIVEWAQKVASMIPKDAIWMTITLDEQMNRLIEIEANRPLAIGEDYETFSN